MELNAQLAARARERGFVVHESDATEFVENSDSRFQGFLLFDFIEHILPEDAERLLAAIPPESVIVIQTPNTNSIVGHQFYLQVPNHVAPYSPAVLARLLARTGYETMASGSLYGGLAWSGVRRKMTEFLLVKILGTVTARLLIEGANYYVVARKA